MPCQDFAVYSKIKSVDIPDNPRMLLTLYDLFKR